MKEIREKAKNFIDKAKAMVNCKDKAGHNKSMECPTCSYINYSDNSITSSEYNLTLLLADVLSGKSDVNFLKYKTNNYIVDTGLKCPRRLLMEVGKRLMAEEYNAHAEKSMKDSIFLLSAIFGYIDWDNKEIMERHGSMLKEIGEGFMCPTRYTIPIIIDHFTSNLGAYRDKVDEYIWEEIFMSDMTRWGFANKSFDRQPIYVRNDEAPIISKYASRLYRESRFYELILFFNICVPLDNIKVVNSRFIPFLNHRTLYRYCPDNVLAEFKNDIIKNYMYYKEDNMIYQSGQLLSLLWSMESGHPEFYRDVEFSPGHRGGYSSLHLNLEIKYVEEEVV